MRKPEIDSNLPGSHLRQGCWARRLIWSAVLGGALAVWFFREPLRNRIAQRAILSNDAPPPELVEGMIQSAPNPVLAIVAAWNSGKIVHREVAVRQIGLLSRTGHPLPAELESVVLAAALDADLDARESALAILRDRNHPALAALAAAQLQDSDPETRVLGMNYLKRVKAGIGVPLVLPLLDENDPFIVSLGLKLLENWSGEKFGVKLSDTMSFENEKTGLKEFSGGSREKANAGAVRAKAWWVAHQAEFPPVRLEVPREAFAARRLVPAGNFSLRALDGRKVRLADFHGKVVLINFWTTWCTACVSEMPELIELQKRHGDKLAIMGVSLDFVPDSHGHIGGHAAMERRGPDDSRHDDDQRDAAALTRVRERVERTVKARGINYPILLDEENEVGGRFNGGELPTTIIVDAQGNVRRRFVGTRSLAVFEEMLAEAANPFPAGAR